MVADALAAQFGVEVDRKRLDLHGHIKTVGQHEIDVRIYQDVTASIVLNVIPIGGELAPEPEAPAVAEVDEAADVEVEAELADEAPEAETDETDGDEAEIDDADEDE